jgi:NAD(P)-dependent dehydrogenase (short-subunit alcohol dehydrogenase family)
MTAVVTGAGQGLGRAIAVALAEAGHSVLSVDINGDAAAETARLFEGKSATVDIADRDAVFELAAATGPIDLLVNNAGIWRFGPLIGLSEADVREVVGVNLFGTLWCTQAFAATMPAGSSIVNLSSAAARMHSAGTGIYPTTKSAIEAMTIQLAVELGPRGIRVNAVAPGSTLTEGTAAILTDDDTAERSRTIPIGRMGEPRDVAAAVLYLSSRAAEYVTGQVLYVDGGLTSGKITTR